MNEWGMALGVAGMTVGMLAGIVTGVVWCRWREAPTIYGRGYIAGRCEALSIKQRGTNE
jgi:hypothetical protein